MEDKILFYCMNFFSKILGLKRKKESIGMYSLSQYFPEGTIYFYGFPSGEDSHFYNAVPPWVEELVASRANVCAGKHVRAVNFAAASKKEVIELLYKMGTPIVEETSRLCLPADITADVFGAERNQRMKKALLSLVSKGSFVMAQPFLSDEFNQLYQFSPEITIHLNDKMSRLEYIPEEYLPKTYKKFENGKEFLEYDWAVPFPTVVKVCSSSAGDGVRICKSAQDVEAAKADFSDVQSTIFLEEYMESEHNICVQFGIPSDPSRQIDIIGHNEQITGPNGEFLGGMVNFDHIVSHQNEVYRVLKEIILPKVREMGWYGVGGIDVLITKEGNFYFIDSNFRMTATFAFVCFVKNGVISRPVLSFVGSFKGSREEFEKKVVPIATMNSKNQKMFIVSLSEKDGTYRFHAGMFFDEFSQIKQNASALLATGIESKTLQRFI